MSISIRVQQLTENLIDTFFFCSPSVHIKKIAMTWKVWFALFERYMVHWKSTGMPGEIELEIRDVYHS